MTVTMAGICCLGISMECHRILMSAISLKYHKNVALTALENPCLFPHGSDIPGRFVDRFSALSYIWGNQTIMSAIEPLGLNHV